MCCRCLDSFLFCRKCVAPLDSSQKVMNIKPHTFQVKLVYYLDSSTVQSTESQTRPAKNTAQVNYRNVGSIQLYETLTLQLCLSIIQHGFYVWKMFCWNLEQCTTQTRLFCLCLVSKSVPYHFLHHRTCIVVFSSKPNYCLSQRINTVLSISTLWPHYACEIVVAYVYNLESTKQHTRNYNYCNSVQAWLK